ncbi:MAG: hypothetical protein AB7E61_06365 [Acholeplasmataceae bacterium]
MKNKYNELSKNVKVLIIVGFFVLSIIFAALTDTESDSIGTTIMSFIVLFTLIVPFILIAWNHQFNKEKIEQEKAAIEEEKIKKQQAKQAAIQKELDDYVEKPTIDYNESLVFIACGVDIEGVLDEIDVLIINNGEETAEDYHSFDNIDDAAYFWDTIDRYLSDNPLLITFKAADELELLKGLRKKADHFPSEYFSIFFNAKEYIKDLKSNNYEDLVKEFNIPQVMYAKHAMYEMLKELVSRGIDINSNKRKIK